MHCTRQNQKNAKRQFSLFGTKLSSVRKKQANQVIRLYYWKSESVASISRYNQPLRSRGTSAPANRTLSCASSRRNLGQLTGQLQTGWIDVVIIYYNIFLPLLLTLLSDNLVLLSHFPPPPSYYLFALPYWLLIIQRLSCISPLWQSRQCEIPSF